MSTFTSSKRTLFQTVQDTPAPNAYSVDHSLLNHDSYKQFGFLDKSQRFQDRVAKDRHNSGDGPISSEECIMNRSPSPPSQVQKPVRSDKEEINKLKREITKLSATLERNQIKYEKELHNMADRIQKSETQLQLVIKEKASLMSQTLLKDKTLHELQYQEQTLKIQLEKSEKNNAALLEKAQQLAPLKRKLEDTEKQQMRVKTHADRKIVHENETLVMQVQKLKTELDSTLSIKDSMSSTIQSLKTENRDFRESINGLNATIQNTKDIHDVDLRRWRDERAEYEKRITQLSEKLVTEKADFAEIIKGVKTSESNAREAANSASVSLERQRNAYLQRIAQLEGDLDIVERSVVDKTKTIETMVDKSRAMQESYQARLAELTAKAERSERVTLLEHEMQQLEAKYKRDVKGLEIIVTEAVTGRDEERQRLESKIKTITQQLTQLEAEHREATHSYISTIDAKTNLVQAKVTEVKELTLLLETTKAHAEELQFSKEDLAQTVASLKTQMKSHTESAETTRHKLETKIQSHLNDMAQLHSQITELKQTLHTTIGRHKTDVSHAQEVREQLTQKLSDMERAHASECSQFKHKVSSLERQIGDLQEQLGVSTQRLVLVGNEHDEVSGKLQQRVNILEKEMTALIADKDAKEVMFTKTKAEMNRQMDALRVCLDQDTTKFQERIDSLNAELEESTTRTMNLEAENARLQQTCHQLENFSKAEKSELRTRLESAEKRINDKSAEMSRLSSHIDTIENENKVLVKQLDDVRMSHLDDTEQLNRCMAELQDDLKKANSQLEYADSASKRLQTIIDNRDHSLVEAGVELSTAKANIAELTLELNKSRQSIDALKKDFSRAELVHADDGDKARLECKQMQHKLDEAISYGQKLELDLQCVQNTRDQLQSEIESLQDKVKLAQKEAVTQRELVMSTLAERDNTHALLGEVENRAATLQQQIKSLLDEMKQVKDDHYIEVDRLRTSHSDAIDEIETRLRHCQTTIESLRDQVAARDVELTKMGASSDAIELKYHVCVQELEDTREQLSGIKLELETAQTTLSVTKESLETQTAKYLKLDIENSKNLQVVESTRSELACVESVLTDTKQCVVKLELERDALTDDIRAKDEQISVLEMSVRETETRITALKEHARELESEQNKLQDRLDQATLLKKEFVQRENELTKQIHNELEPCIKALELQVSEKTISLSKLSSQMHDENIKAKEAQFELEQRLAAVTAEREKLDVAFCDLNKQVAESETNARISREKADSFECALKTSDIEHQQALEKQQQELAEIVEMHSKSFADMTCQRDSIQSKLDKVVRENEDIRKAMDKTIVEMQREHVDLKEKLTVTLDSLDMIRSSRDTLQSELDALKQISQTQIDLFEAKLAASESSLSEQTKAISSLETELASKQNELAALHDEHVSLSRTFEFKSKEFASTLEQMNSKNAAQARTIKFHIAEQERLESEKNQEVAQLQEKLAHHAAKMTQLEVDLELAHKEMSTQQSLIVKNEGRLANESKHFEASVQELTTKLAVKTTRAKELESRLVSVTDELSIVQLRHDNLVDSRNFEIKQVKNQYEVALNELTQLKKKYNDAVALSQKSTRLENDLEMMTEKKKQLQTKLDEYESKSRLERDVLASKLDETNQKFAEQEERCIQMRILLEDSERIKEEMQASFDASLKMLQVRGSLNEAETKKIGELNAELFGHANNLQKIKHLSQIKEENIKLKTRSAKAEQDRDRLKERVISLEKELDALRPLGGIAKRITVSKNKTFGGPKFNTSHYHASGSNATIPRTGGMVGADTEETKHDESVTDTTADDTFMSDKASRGTGGVSFFIS
ncbi:hypothetical protein MT418_005268 [Batrachochytrium dendrobatidis]